MSIAALAQTLVIPAWHPKTSPNNQKRHWRAVQQNHHHDRDMAWASAKHAGWTFVPGRVRLTITFVYPRKYRVDADNLVARCKGILDGLKGRGLSLTLLHTKGIRMADTRHGFFEDDSSDILELRVRSEVRPGCKATELVLEPIQ